MYPMVILFLNVNQSRKAFISASTYPITSHYPAALKGLCGTSAYVHVYVNVHRHRKHLNCRQTVLSAVQRGGCRCPQNSLCICHMICSGAF